MGKMSKRKGNAMENDIAKQLRAYFMPSIDPKLAYQMVHRTPLSGGHVERGDLIIKPPVWELFPWFIECRNRENWNWKQVWEQGQNSLIMQWFLKDAAEKCHPYDQNQNYERQPLLLFTKNMRRVYFVAWVDDLTNWFNVFDVTKLNPMMYISVKLDNMPDKKYVVIGDFEQLLHQHLVLDSNAMQQAINTYLGVVNERVEDSDSG